ncbi:ankyrin repeat domain-containing protein 12-like isoform X2 [Xyrauchen texanus]|uniref:ankyrin repeat domain-containing protein 12-like isoform X2 n=1 Tax=Xyrauchen texanus TaxID=154827 RepID=UPI002241DE47|nr:ankyrin repeat domain-containing protein 12-like isoform X2 [Xyrauchen texanus]
MAKPGLGRDGAMVEKTAEKKSKEKMSPFVKTPKLDRSEILGKEGKSKSSMKRKLSFTISPPHNEELHSDADKDVPDKKKVKKESGTKKSTPVNILFGYPLSERKQMALVMQMTARDNSPETTPSHPSQMPPVQKKIASSSSSRQKDKVNKRNERGETPLHMAAIRGEVKQVKELISLGADVNVKDFAGWTPLHEACNLGYYDVAKVLIGAGAEVNTQGLDNDTPLHDASSSGYKDIVKLLLCHGGNAYQANKRGERPVDVADSQEIEQLLKGEIPLSEPEESSSESEDPPSVNPSSVDENMEYSDAEKDSDCKSTSVKASSSMSGLDEYEFKDEEEENDLSKALNDRHILKRELRQKAKEEKEKNHYALKQGCKSDQSMLACKSKKTKATRIYCSSDSSSDEAEMPLERRSSPTRSISMDGHKTDNRFKKECLNLTPAEQKEKGKQKKKNKSQSKNKENQELQEEGKENSKSLIFSTATVSDNSDRVVREEDSFKMSFSAKDDTSVHLFQLVKSPKLNHNQTDKQTTPLKQENTKTCVSIGDGSCPMESIKCNHYTESDFCTEGSSSKSCKHKEKSKHHHKELSLDGDDGNSSPFKDSMDSSEYVFRKTDNEGEAQAKKHKLKHKEKEKYRKEYEAERNRHRQKEARKDGHRNMEFDREFWKENFFKSDESEELTGKCETPGGRSPPKSSGSSPVKEERGASKDKHSSSSSSRDRRPKEEREKDKAIKKEKKEVPIKDERGKDGKGGEIDDRTEGLVSGRMSEGSLHSSVVKEEMDDKPITVNLVNQDQQEKNTQEKNDKRVPTMDRETEKSDKKHADKDKKVKSDHSADKPELHNSTDRWKEKEKLTSISNSPNDKSHKDGEKLKAMSVMKKHEENKKNKEKLDKRAEKEHSSGDHKEKTSSEKKTKAPEKTTDHGKSDRTKEKEREKEKDSDKRKKDKLKEPTPSSSSYSNLKLLLEEKKSYISENNKVISSKSKEEVTKTSEKDKDRRERDRESERHRDRERDRHKDKDKDRLQQNKDGKISKAKPSEVDSKPKIAPALKDTRPKEKRLVDDDLMKTSFERMLSQKDQEIEQWHRKHLEKMKQKERERLKQRPGIDMGKQKSKDKMKISSLSSEPCLTKELTRSKSSEASEGRRERTSKDATSGRTLSLDTKNLTSFGKNGPVTENNLSRSPRPESERSGLMSRSVSMISVASSEDSCQATIFTPKPPDYDSDLNMDASDSQPPFLQSALVLQSSKLPSVLDKETSSLPESAFCNRTPLSSRHASPCLRAILDEEAKVPPAETRQSNESQKITVSHSGNEQAAVHQTEMSATPVQEKRNSQCLTGTLPDGESQMTSTEGEGISPVCQVQLSLHLHKSTAKDLSSQQGGLTQDNVFQTHLEMRHFCNNDSQVEQASLGQLDIADTVMTEESNKDSPLCVVSQVASSQTQNSSETSVPLHSSSLQWETALNSSIEQTPRSDSCLRPEQKEKTSVVAENKIDKSVENIPRIDHTSTANSSIGTCRSSSEENVKPLLRTINVQEDTEKDASVQEEGTSRFSSESLVTVDAQPEKLVDSLHSASTNMSHCTSPERNPEEPIELSEEDSDESRVTETDAAKVLEEGVTTHTLNESKADVEMSDHLAVEELPAKSNLPARGEHGQSNTGFQQDPQVEPPSGGNSGSSSPLSVVERDSDTSGTRAKLRLLEEEGDIQVTHPRKRKMLRVLSRAQANLTDQQVKEKTQQSLAAIVDALKLEEIQPYQTERANPYYEYLHIRKKIEEKRKVLCSVIPQAPQYYDEYVTFNGSYLLDGNPLSKLCIPTITPPPSLPEPLKEMFKQQEMVRMKLRLQHSIEREKLIVSNEQEVLRVHYRAARTLANQTLPFSACTVLLDAEVYNMPQDIQGDDGKTSVRDRFNARQFMSWLQDVDDKFDKLKTCLLMRQQHEAAALNAVQRLEWQLKLQELDPATYKSTSIFEIPEFYIPLVEVNDNFDLTPI